MMGSRLAVNGGTVSEWKDENKCFVLLVHGGANEPTAGEADHILTQCS